MQVSVSNYILSQLGYPSLKEGLAATGATAVEISVDRQMQAPALDGGMASLADAASIRHYRQALDAGGLHIPALLLANNFNAPDLDGELEWVARCVAAAHGLGCKAVRIDSAMSGQAEMSLELRIERFIACLRQVLDATRDTPLPLGIENHGAQGNDPRFLDGVIQGIGDSRLGLTMDTGNFYWSGRPLEEVLQILGHFAFYARHVHVKNIHYPEAERSRQREVGWKYGEYACPVAEGDIDHRLVVAFLREAEYEGDLCVEDESIGRFPKEKRLDVLKGDLAYVARLI